MAAKPKAGPIGAGKIGRVHAENLAFRVPKAELVAVSDIYQEAAEKCAAGYQVTTVYNDPRPILGSRGLLLLPQRDSHGLSLVARAEAHSDSEG